MRRATVTCPRPRPPGLKHSPTARVLWEKKVGSLRSASPPTGELLISLPVEQQLQELKPNGSNSGNRKIPTLSSCRQGRRESPPVDGVSTPRSGRWASVPSPGGLVAGAPCIRVNEASGAVIRGDPKHRWPARPQLMHAPLGQHPGETFPARTWQNTYRGKPVATGYLLVDE